jgi:hypothetical protein
VGYKERVKDFRVITHSDYVGGTADPHRLLVLSAEFGRKPGDTGDSFLVRYILSDGL